MKYHRYSQLAGALIFFILCAGAFYFFLQTIKKNQAEKQITLEAYMLEKNRQEEVRSLNNLVKSVEKEKKELESHFSSVSEPVKLLNTIESLAGSVGLGYEVTALDAVENGAGLSVMLRVTGSFEAIYRFLTLLENGPYEIRVDAFNIEKKSEEEGKGSVWTASFQITLLTFIE